VLGARRHWFDVASDASAKVRRVGGSEIGLGSESTPCRSIPNPSSTARGGWKSDSWESTDKLTSPAPIHTRRPGLSPQFSSRPRLGIPAANHARLPALRISSTGLGHSSGAGARVVDPEISVRFQRHTSGRCVELDKWSRSFTDQSGEHALTGILPDAVSAATRSRLRGDLLPRIFTLGVAQGRLTIRSEEQSADRCAPRGAPPEGRRRHQQ
jgi:hypothetical protein